MQRSRWTLAALLFAGATAIATSAAQPVRREVLKDLHLSEAGGCQHITAELEFPFTVEGFAPIDGGTLLTVRVIPLQLPELVGRSLTGREALVPDAGTDTPLQEVEWDGSGGEGPLLLFHFRRAVTYDVTGGKDFRSVLVTLHPDTKDPAPCQDGPEPPREPEQ
jgi:hypothetical protein